MKRGGRFERAGGRLTLNPRAEPVEWGARKASRRSSVAARTKSPGGTTRQYSARDHRECTRSVSPRPRLVSFRLASLFVPDSSKSEFFYLSIHVSTYIYIYLGEKSEFIDLSSDSYPPILILPSLLPCLLSSLFIRPTDANRHTLLYPTLLVKTIRPLVNLPPRFSSHIRLTGKKNRERGEGGREGRMTGIFDLPPDLVQTFSNAFESISSQFLASFLRPISIESLDPRLSIS